MPWGSIEPSMVWSCNEERNLKEKYKVQAWSCELQFIIKVWGGNKVIDFEWNSYLTNGSELIR